ncbi:hypothetical protein [Gynuella sp.]|uniref:hypothetical protein n=1 Tax=Gynuella sp. TaxID=2969146 RepID=UPI003D1215F7
MSVFSLPYSLLPDEHLEKQLGVKLCHQVERDFHALQEQRPRIYQELLSYYLASRLRSARESVTQRDATLFWEILKLTEQQTCSELVIMTWQRKLYIGYLDILPDTYGLFAPLDPTQAMIFVESLIHQTLDNILGLALSEGCIALVTTLINPNLALIFRRYGFIMEKSDISGLPLPARFHYPVSLK